MNNTYYETLDENFAQALKLFENEYSHKELIDFLRNGNIVQKQISVLRLEKITSKYDADILLNNLTGQDGKVREAVSLRLNEFVSNPEYTKYFENCKNCDIFLDAIVDINANICRNIISTVSFLKSNNDFCTKFSAKLVDRTLDLLKKIEKFDFQEGKYKVNKEVFKLYWCLEAMYEYADKINFKDLKNILLRAKNIQEYTIREKTAKILSLEFEDYELIMAKEQLMQDSNYYVRRFK